MPEVLEDFSLQKNQTEKKKGSIHKIGVVGCGSMGQEICRLSSQFGLDVVFVDLTDELVAASLESIAHQLDIEINKWGMTQSEKKLILSRINGATQYAILKDCDLVIEAINTRKKGASLEERKEVFSKIEEVVCEECVIASNTSTLMISDLAADLRVAERAVGMHFIAPASKVKIVEVVRGLKTSDDAYDMVLKFAKMVGREVIPTFESPGNISTRLIVSLINEACNVLMEGVASVEDIDKTMRYGFGLQFGPLELADRIGLDNLVKWMDNLYMEFGEAQFKASPIIKRLVRSGQTGRKADRGFYRYEAGKCEGNNVICSEIK